MNIYKVKESDLIGDIKDFPIEIVQKMVKRQHQQTGKCDVTVFQRNSTSNQDDNGFDWTCAKEGSYFWRYVIGHKVFKNFFVRYPKQQIQEQEQEEDCWIKPDGVRMLVWEDDEKWAEEKFVIAKLPKNAVRPYIAVSQDYEREFKKGEEYFIIHFKNAKPIPQTKEITMQENADKFNLNVNEFRIV